jgi:hypothetical protein
VRYVRECVQAPPGQQEMDGGPAVAFQQTRTLQDTLTPLWREPAERFVLDLPKPSKKGKKGSHSHARGGDPARLVASLWDYDMASKDDLLAVFSYDQLSTLLAAPAAGGEGEAQEMWLESHGSMAALARFLA